MMISETEARSNVAENMRAACLRIGWTTADLAVKLDGYVPRNTVFRIARGENMGGVHHLAAIADVLGVTIDYLLSKPSQNAKVMTTRRKVSSAG